MNRIILIGNGFDLAHGLDTGYGHFIADYWRQFSEKIYQSDQYNGHTLRQYTDDKLVELRLTSTSPIISLHENELASSF